MRRNMHPLHYIAPKPYFIDDPSVSVEVEKSKILSMKHVEQ